MTVEEESRAPGTTAPTDRQRRGIAAIADQGWLLMMLPGAFWAGNAILGRAVAGVLPPIGLAFWRWFTALLIMLPLAWPHLRRDLPVMLRHLPMMAVLAFFGVAVFNTLLYTAAHTTSAINIVMLQAATPVLIVAFSYFIFGDRVTARQAVGIAISLAGAVTLVSEGDINVILGLQINRGDLWMLTAVACYAAYTALFRAAPKVHPFSFVIGTFALGCAMLVPFYLWESVTVMPMPVTWVSVAAILYVGIFPSLLGYIAFNRVVVLLGANVGGLALHLVPVFGTIFAALLLHELPQAHHFAGIALIAAGIYLATRKPAAGG